MATTWLYEYMQNMGCVETDGQQAVGFYDDGTGDPTTITADNFGTIGDSITLVGNGTDTINDLVSAWNSANPDNTCSITMGTGTLIVPDKYVIEFKGGQDAGLDCTDVFNTKEDAEVLKGLFIGRRTHQQHVDIHTIKKMKMWDIL